MKTVNQRKIEWRAMKGGEYALGRSNFERNPVKVDLVLLAEGANCANLTLVWLDRYVIGTHDRERDRAVARSCVAGERRNPNCPEELALADRRGEVAVEELAGRDLAGAARWLPVTIRAAQSQRQRSAYQRQRRIDLVSPQLWTA